MHLLVPLLALLAPTTGLTEAEFATALRGEVPIRSESFITTSGKDAGRGLGAIIVERPIAEVWGHLSRWEDKPDYIPRLKQVTILDKQPNQIHAHMLVDATITTARYTAFYKLDEAAHVIHWSLDSGAKDNTIKDVDGDYRLFELSPTRTLVVYRTYVDSGIKVAQFIQKHMMLKSIPELLRNIKKRVESNGVWKKK